MSTYGGAYGCVGGFNRMAVSSTPGLFRLTAGGQLVILVTSQFGAGGSAYPSPPPGYTGCVYEYIWVEYLLNTGARVVSSHLTGLTGGTIGLPVGLGIGNCDVNQTFDIIWQFGSYDSGTGLHSADGFIEIKGNGSVQFSATGLALGSEGTADWDTVVIGPAGSVSTETALSHTNGGLKSLYVNDRPVYGSSSTSLINETYTSSVDADLWKDLNSANRWTRTANGDTAPSPKMATADTTRIVANIGYMSASLSPRSMSTQPVAIAVPLAAQTPCTPQATVGNGGKGKAGCNVGGVGGGHQYTISSDTLGNVPQHADPVDGETLTGKEGVGVETWIELVHTDYPSEVVTTYRRAFEELADDSSYQGGRKQSGLLAVGDVENALGNEQGAFEAASADIQLSDVRDRLIRDLADDQELEGDELRIKLGSDPARSAATPPRILMRGIVQKPALTTGLQASLTVVDALFSDFGPFGPDQRDPNWTFGDLGSACPQMTSDTKAQAIPWLYGEKSDEGAVDPLTNLPAAKGLLPGFYLGKFDLTGLVSTPPDATGRTLEAVIALMQGLLDAGTPAVSWVDTLGFDIGTADAQTLIDAGSIPDTYDTLAHVIGYADLDALLAIGTTPAPAATEWGFICTGLGPWFEYTGVYGSDLGGGDPTKTHDRTKLDPTSRSDVLVPGINWPYSNPYLELTNDDGRVFWLTGVFATGPLLDDHLNGVITMAFNAVGIEEVGDGTGLPIMRAEDVKQHWLENHRFGQWSSGPYATTLSYPQWEDGTPKVRSSSFTTRQAFFKQQLGNEGLIFSWYLEKQQSTSDTVVQLNTATESVLGVNGHGQLMDWGLDETVDPTNWDRIDHVTDIFGPLVRTSGEERQNVVTGSCDWDADFDKYRIGPIAPPYTSTVGVAKYKNRRKPGDPVDSPLLDNETHFRWLLQRRLARLEVGTTLVEATGPIGWLDRDVGDGVLLTSIEGPGSDGYEDQPFFILRRQTHLPKLGQDDLLVTYTLWDVGDILIETAFTNGLDRLAEETTGSTFLETDDADLAPLEMR